MSDWIEHDGQSRPNLPAGTLVRTKHSNGWTDDTYKASAPTWEWWDEPDDESSGWIDTGEPDRTFITHYRVVS